MLRTSLLVVALFFTIGTFTANSLSPNEARQNYRQWLEERYQEATSVRAGMSRAELIKVFEEDGGLQRIPAGRYVLRSCHMIKVEAEFDVEYGRDYKERPDKELKIKEISKPFLEYEHTD